MVKKIFEQIEKLNDKYVDVWEDILNIESPSDYKEGVDAVGEYLKKIYNYADIFHCEPIEKVADDFIQKCNITNGNFDNITNSKYSIPDYWDIGEVFARLIEDSYDDKDVIIGIKNVYNSWIAEKILNFNSDLYYQSREYLALSYKEGHLLIA